MAPEILNRAPDWSVQIKNNTKGGKEMKKNYSIITAAIVFSMLLAVGTAAPVQATQAKGDSSLMLGGSFYHTQGTDVGVLNLDLGYGYFLTENWEVGVLQTLWYDIVDDEDDSWWASTIPYFNYNFRTQEAFQPFVGAFIGVSYNEDDVTGTLGPQLGFKSFVNDSTFVIVKYRYEWFFDELDFEDIEDSSSEGNHVVTLGVGFVF